MTQEITDLTAAVSTLQTQVSAAVANEQSLKQKLDAALAGVLSPADKTALVNATSAIKSANQALSDATAQFNPSN